MQKTPQWLADSAGERPGYVGLSAVGFAVERHLVEELPEHDRGPGVVPGVEVIQLAGCVAAALPLDAGDPALERALAVIETDGAQALGADHRLQGVGGQVVAVGGEALPVPQPFGWLMIGWGVYTLFSTEDQFGGIWWIVLGWLIAGSAKSAAVSARVTDRLEGVTVGDIMDTSPVTLPASTRLIDAEEWFERYHSDWFAVVARTWLWIVLAVIGVLTMLFSHDVVERDPARQIPRQGFDRGVQHAGKGGGHAVVHLLAGKLQRAVQAHGLCRSRGRWRNADPSAAEGENRRPLRVACARWARSVPSAPSPGACECGT